MIRTSLFASLVLVLFGLPLAAAEKPNIVFILADDLGWRDLGCYGQTRIRTPHIDRIAAEGMIFRNAFVTNPICGPSRAVILTGRLSHSNGVLNHEHWTSDGIAFDATKPNEYLTKFPIGLKGKQKVVGGKIVEK